jgi:hypothetical protein
MSKRLTETRKAELVETHNLMLALMRLQDSALGYDNGDRWKRALYHAAAMAGLGRGQVEKIRIALELP